MSDAIITTPAYIVMDIPSPMAEKVRAFRHDFDFERSLLPAEITLTGSCGTGLITKGQTASEVAEYIDSAAKRLHPFSVAFDSVGRFDNTNIFFMTLKDPAPVVHAHEVISKCGLKFDPNSYPYQPHCTLKLRKEPDDVELLKLLFLNVPHDPFVLDTISVYQLADANTCELIHKVELK